MESLKRNTPVILLIVFELIVGILLMINPDAFTRAVIIFFGIVMIVIAIVYILRYFREKKEFGESSSMTLTLAVVALIVGLICVVLTNVILGIFAIVALVYGVMLIISGIFKFKSCLDAKKYNRSYSFVMVLSAVLSIVLGVVIVINPFTTMRVLWMFVGLSLIFAAVIDLIGVVLTAQKNSGRIVNDR